MKLSTSLLVSAVSASHYRGGTYKVTQQGNNQISIVNTQTWRLGSDQYGTCEQSDILNQVQSDGWMSASCTQGTCQSANLFYTALFIGDDYCYGDGENLIPKPTSAYRFGWDSCCWVDLTDDFGNRYNGGRMEQYMKINDVDNNTPVFKLPPLWLIMAGCPDQKVELKPNDLDGDRVKCRWAVGSDEAGGAEHIPAKHPSLTLDEDNCTVWYDGTKDASQVGVKPIALMMEDFDSNNNVRSSIPVQFLAQVWTPNMNTRSIGYDNYPKWFDGDEHPDHEDFPTRGRRSLPNYCTAVPYFVAPTPRNGVAIDGSSGSVSFTLKAQSDFGYIAGFSYQAPSGLLCTTVDSNGQITCNWTMTPAQLKIKTHSFCYEATDSLGLVTERRCLTIEGAAITNILEMATHVLDGSGANGFTASDGIDYGCAGRDTYDAFSPTQGRQMDASDKASYVWKKCVQCATNNDKNAIKPYDYDADADSCGEFF